MTRDEGGPRGRTGLRARLGARRTQAACYASAAILFGLWAFDFGVRDAKLGPDAPVADATVVEVSLGRASSVVVDFLTRDGREIRTETEDFYFDPEPRVGDAARVRYDADDPTEYVRDVRVGRMPWFLAMLAGLSAAFLVVAVLRWK